MKKIKVDRSDKFLPLLTDTIPFDKPSIFSNRGFYLHIKELYNDYYKKEFKDYKKNYNKNVDKKISLNSLIEFFNQKFITKFIKDFKEKCFKEFVPYKYKIKKNFNEDRVMSLIHPASQIEICDLYMEHSDDILFYTNNSSNISLRYPTKKVTKFINTSKINTDTIKTHEEYLSKENINITSNIYKLLHNTPNNYFLLAKYPKLYKFYDSYYYLELEKKFKYCKKLDIANFFNSIYTHSVSWALLGKEVAKKLKDKTDIFANKIDKVMRESNYGETHGIPIGSEFSRIFAEIILQTIDCSVLEKLNRNYADKKRVNWEIKRYIDDFFIFYNDDRDCEEIENSYKECFNIYLFTFNQDKSNILTSPFITPESYAKINSDDCLRDFLNAYHGVRNKREITYDNFCSNKYTKNNKLYFIGKYKTIIFQNNKTSSLISLLFIKIYKEIRHICGISDIWNYREEKKERQQTIVYYFNDIIYIVFYFLIFAPKNHIFLEATKILIWVIDFAEKLLDAEYKKDLYLEIFNKISKFIEDNTDNSKIYFISWCDLMLVLIKLQKLEHEFKLTNSLINKLVKKTLYDSDTLNYFEIGYMLFYIKNDELYKEELNNIEEYVKKHYKNIKHINKAEDFMFYFDFIACPWVNDDVKKEIIKCVNPNITDETKIFCIKNKIMEKKKKANKYYWFIDWDWDINNKEVLDILDKRLIDYN